MPRYFFHSQDGEVVVDPDGTELVSTRDAKREAVRMMGSMIADKPDEFWNTASLKVMVTDTAGVLLFALDLSAVEAPKEAA